MLSVDRNRCRVLSGFLAGAALGALCSAGGFKIQDQSTRAMGMVDAFVAGADDASAVYYNPAGLTRLRSDEVIGNLYIAHGTTYYDGPGGEWSSDGRIYTVPSFYAGFPRVGGTDVALGIGLYSPYGLGSRWADDAPVNIYTTLAEIGMVNVNPTLALPLTDTLSIGFGLDYFTGKVKNRFILDYSQPPYNIPGAGLGEVDLDGEGDGWGYNFGLQWQCTEQVALALTYRSQVNVHYEGDAQFDDVPPFLIGGASQIDYNMDTDIQYPASVTGAVAWQATDRLRLEFAAQWDQWSTRDEQIIYLDGMPGAPFPLVRTTRLDWDDSWILMAGGEYVLNEKWTLRAGYAFNEMPAPTDTADPSIPTDDMHVFGFGLGYAFSEQLELDFAALVAYGKERTLKDSPNAPRRSEYSSVSTFASVGMTYRF